ncbi:diguanylate cyclase [Erythrobacter sp.]|uniref:diguanylate cyclase n=1 Tax=Erythrobacter sp. TaxID=1042 RepID=UPI001425FBCB|nr:diguanylate cyclase [Erythrobacter sp.]QIQ86624.1 MAG: diguanylate cyclase [Erythrobacter sp.]
MTESLSGGEAGMLALDPAAALLATIALAAALTVYTCLRHPLAARGTTRPSPDPLGDLFRQGGHERAMRRSRPSAGARSDSVMAARIDRLESHGRVWDEDARRKATEQVAKVLRAGIRRSDEVRTIPGEGFVIVIENAREDEAVGIAQRLRRALAGARIPGMGADLRVTASFGIAEGRPGESLDEARARAGGALDAATASGEDCVIAASEIEEILFLPPPAAAEAPQDLPRTRAA